MSAGMIAGTIGGALLPLIGTGIGEALSAGDRDKARKAQEAAIAQILGLAPPSIDSQELSLEDYVSQGTLTPEQEQVHLLGQSAMEGISTNPKYKEAMLLALGDMQERSKSGLTETDMADRNAILRSAAGGANARQQAIAQKFQEQGRSSPGLELAAQLSASQAGAEQAAVEGDNLAARAQQAAYQAAIDSGKFGAQMEDQEWGQKEKVATAQDLFKQYNAKWSNDASGANADRRTRAGELNLTNKQRIADANTNLGNSQQMHNKGLIGNRYGQDVDKAKMAQGAYNDQGAMHNADADHTLGTWSGIGSTLGKAASSAGSMGMGGGGPDVSKAASEVSSEGYTMPELGSSYRKKLKKASLLG